VKPSPSRPQDRCCGISRSPPRCWPHSAPSPRYASEQHAIEEAAREKERERDEKSAEADHLLARHRRFANSVALIQVSIALGAVAALTRNRAIWLGSITLGAVGAVIFFLTLIR